MRTFSAIVAALSLGACAAQPRTLADVIGQVRSAFDRQSCAGPFSIVPGHDQQAQPRCLNENPMTQTDSSVQVAESHRSKSLVDARPVVLNGGALQPRLEGAREAVTVSAGVPALDIEASCHPAENLAVDQNAARCLSSEGSARDQLAHKWTEFPSADRLHCMRYTTTGGGGTYTDLLTCLEMDSDARHLETKNRSVANQ
jgi:hypothetical protein